MKRGTHPVKIRAKDENGKVTGSKEVGTAVFDIYDSVGEALDNLGEAKTLEMINAQNRTNELNKVRGVNRPGGMSKTALRNKALLAITGPEWASVAGDQVAMEALISTKMAEIEKALTEADDDQQD